MFGFNNIANANDCTRYKITPKITINVPDWAKTVVQPNEPMDLLHGNVVATLVNNYDIIADYTRIKGGYCIRLKEVEATIGYTDFLVKIDNRHNPQSCSYNAILNHENKHIDAYLSVIDEHKQELYNSLYSATDSIMPIFIKEQSEMDSVVDKLNDDIQKHPDVVLAIQKIHAAEEIKNKNIDVDENYSEIKKCLE